MFSRVALKKPCVRRFSQIGSVRNSSSLKKRLAEIIPIKAQEVKEVIKVHGEKVLGNCTVEQAYGGARDVKCLVTETSLLDAQEVRYISNELTNDLFFLKKKREFVSVDIQSLRSKSFSPKRRRNLCLKDYCICY